MSKAFKTALALAAVIGSAGVAHAKVTTTDVWVDNPYIPGLRTGNYYTIIQVQSISGTTAQQEACGLYGVVSGATLAGTAKVASTLATVGTAVTVSTGPTTATKTTTYVTTASKTAETLISGYVLAAFGNLVVPVTCKMPAAPHGMALAGGTNVSVTATKAPLGFSKYVAASSPVESAGGVAPGTFTGTTTCKGILPANTAGTLHTASIPVLETAQNPSLPSSDNFIMSHDSNSALVTQDVLFKLSIPTINTSTGAITYKLTNECYAQIGVHFNRVGE